MQSLAFLEQVAHDRKGSTRKRGARPALSSMP